jgi:Uma2 family endonuclease
VVEILSTDWAADIVKKAAKYAATGLERYWIVDPEGPEIIEYRLRDGTYVEVARHEASAKAELSIGPATVKLDPAQLLT